MNGFDRQEEGTADSQNIERAPAPRAFSSEWTLRSSFIGPQGIRSGWSMLIFIVILVVEVLATRVPVNRLLHSMKHNPTLEAWSPAVAAGILALLVLVATAIMAKIEGRPVLSYGFTDKRRLSRFVLGIAAGVAALSALVLALKVSGWLIFDGRALRGESAWSYGLQWGIAFLLTALFEESLLRGYLQSTLTRGVGFWWAAVLLSLAFRRHASAQSWRIADRDFFCGGRWSAILLELMADQVALLGSGTTRWLGLVSVLSLWSTRQRPGGERAPFCDAPFGRAAMEWWPDRAGRQHLYDSYYGSHRARRVDYLEPTRAV
jgi:membrane protease YdiL (CAAX protease family)